MGHKRTYLKENFKSLFFASTMSMLVEYLVLLSDKLIAGHMVGQEALSALMLVEPFFSIIIFVAYLIADGSDMLITYEKSRGNEKRANEYFTQSVCLTVVSGIALTVIFALFGKQILYIICEDKTLYDYAVSYFSNIVFLPLFQIGSSVLYSVILYQGGESSCNAFSGIYVISNIALSVIFCHFYGIAGISLATVVSNVLGMIPLVLFLLCSKKGQLRLVKGMGMEHGKQLVRISFSQSSIYLLMAVYEMMMNTWLMKNFGGNAIIIFALVMNLQTFYLTLYEGLTDFVTSNVNVCLGEKNYRGIDETMKLVKHAAMMESMLFAGAIVLAAPLLPKMFGIDQELLVQEGTWALRMFGICSVCYCFIDVYRKYYVSVGRVGLSLFLNIIRVSPLAVLMGMAAGRMSGMRSLWTGMAVGLFLSAGLFVLYLWTIHKENTYPEFLPQKELDRQWQWDEPMTDEGIMKLVDLTEQILKAQGAAPETCFRAMQMIEESQIIQKGKTKNPEKVIIQCTVMLEKTVTIVLRNTASLFDTSDQDKKIESFADFAGTQILSKANGFSYHIIQGSNREVFTIKQ